MEEDEINVVHLKSKNKASRVFLRLSLFIFGVFVLIHLLGFKQYTSVLIGAGSFQLFDTFRGVCYVAFYFSSIAIVPLLLLSVLFLKVISKKSK
jgi:hypothetical protein